MTPSEAASEANTKPLLFLSHKHSDRAIANVLREFIYQATNRDVDVYQSSNVDAQGPQLGRQVTNELTAALWRTGAVILIYTTDDQDWHWCMWECGVAMVPNSPPTRIIVLQCSTTSPSVFEGALRANAADKDSVLKLVNSLLTDREFFPGRPAVARNLSPSGDEVRRKANELYTALAAVLPKNNATEWSTQPLIRLQLPLETTKRLRDEPAAGSSQPGDLAADVVVIELNAQASQIFGLGNGAAHMSLAQLAERWKSSGTKRKDDWLNDLACQVRCVARGELPAIGWGFLGDAKEDRYVPILSRSRTLPAKSTMEFDVNLVKLDESAALRARDRMIPIDQIAYHHIEQTPIDQLKVKALLERLKRDGHTRLPFLTAERLVKLVVHRSTVASYVADKVASGEDIDIARLTLRDLMNEDKDAGKLFAGFATVAPSDSLNDVRLALGHRREIQDVFVTTTGTADAPVLGWITNAMLAETL